MVQAVTFTPSLSNPRPLGMEGHISGLNYDFVMPGGCNSASLLLQLPPGYRSDALNPGRIIRMYKGTSVVWDGKLAEQVSTKDGWQVTAVGLGVLGTDFAAMWGGEGYSLNSPIDNAVTRGLRWGNASPGITAGWLSGGADRTTWPDNASFTVTDHMTNITAKQGMTWYVSRPQGNSLTGKLNTFQLPTYVNRLLVSSDPVPRSVFGELTTLWVSFMYSDDNNGNQVTQLTRVSLDGTVQEPVGVLTINDIAAHGPNELYIDITGAGVLPQAQAQQMALNLLAKYGRSAWGGPFSFHYGNWLTLGGSPIDIATDQAGSVARVLVSDAPFGGEVLFGALEFVVGKYSYDDDSQIATATPYQSYLTDLQTLLSSSIAWA